MKYYVYLKSINGNHYYSVDLGYLTRLGQIICLGEEKYKVIGGQCLPR